MPLKDKHEITQGDGNKQGICGFTTMSQLIIDHGKITLKDYEKKYAANTIKFTEEWMERQIKHDEKLAAQGGVDFTATSLNQSLMFTADFGDKYKRTVDELKKGLWQKKGGFALIPEAIGHYLHKHYGIAMKADTYDDGKGNGKSIKELWKDTKNNLGHGIYGVRKSKANNTAKGHQLSHYIYIDKAGNIMTWGKQNAPAYKAIAAKYEQVLIRLYPG